MLGTLLSSVLFKEVFEMIEGILSRYNPLAYASGIPTFLFTIVGFFVTACIIRLVIQLL